MDVRVGTVIHWELCKGIDHVNNWHQYKPEYIQENKNKRILQKCDNQIDHSIQANQKERNDLLNAMVRMGESEQLKKYQDWEEELLIITKKVNTLVQM